ncbi:hypothetical protein PACTADRAFT_36771 [Pachysolen tannophilus NRRL Y-2460]|uniref:Protein N-terminal and lysine N-methyltransferase EFM7 n=1 Tax=Pachysolen tannophilus NRRL Y-2460 TaxID=669874 RepID=A0A1E4U2Q6_PACTA|nr:hypothetical protein PACTADRAFT_36771 [Pachysolen tannophilus NRRL Y-2460]
MSDSDEISLNGDMFQEPEGYFKPEPEPHFATYERIIKNANPQSITLRLVGKSPLWGHLLWNAGIYTANYLDEHAETLVKGKNVLELGAGSALPSLICGLNDAKKVVATDYPEPELISNIDYNIKNCPGLNERQNVIVKGYIWGNDYEPFTSEIGKDEKFDLIILADLVFNHTEHLKLLETCKKNISANGCCFVVFSPHRPKLIHADLDFFEKAKEFGFRVEKNDLVRWKPIFEEESETIEIRSRIYSYFLYPDWNAHI